MSRIFRGNAATAFGTVAACVRSPFYPRYRRRQIHDLSPEHAAGPKRLRPEFFKREKGDVSHTVALALHVLTACNMFTFWGVNTPDYAQSISNCNQTLSAGPRLQRISLPPGRRNRDRSRECVGRACTVRRKDRIVPRRSRLVYRDDKADRRYSVAVIKVADRRSVDREIR